MEFKEALVVLHKLSGLEPKELAKRASISAGYLSMLESGERVRPGPAILLALAQALDATVGQLLGSEVIPGYGDRADHVRRLREGAEAQQLVDPEWAKVLRAVAKQIEESEDRWIDYLRSMRQEDAATADTDNEPEVR